MFDDWRYRLVGSYILLIHVRLHLVASVFKLRYDWTCQLKSEQGPNPCCRFTAAKHVKDQNGFRSMQFGVGLLLHHVIKPNKNLETRIHSNQEYPWDHRKNTDSCILSFGHLPSGRNCNSSQGGDTYSISCVSFFYTI